MVMALLKPSQVHTDTALITSNNVPLNVNSQKTSSGEQQENFMNNIRVFGFLHCSTEGMEEKPK
jgi:hypothetical protein